MKTTQLVILFVSIFLTAQLAMAQDDFYASPKKQKPTSKATTNQADTVKIKSSTPLIDENDYLSYDEYYEKKYAENPAYVEENTEYTESEDDEHCQKTSNGRLSGEIVAEIFYNVAFTFLIIWGSR